MNFKITKKKCQQGINGVCEGCGGKLEPIETVDNAGDPTYWCGCKHCSCFRSGVDRIHFEIARQLILENTMIPYPSISGKNGTPEEREYWLDSQTAGLSPDIARIHKMISEKGTMTKLIRQCEGCNYKEEQRNFIFLGDDVWVCPMCGYKYTHLAEVTI